MHSVTIQILWNFIPGLEDFYSFLKAKTNCFIAFLFKHVPILLFQKVLGYIVHKKYVGTIKLWPRKKVETTNVLDTNRQFLTGCFCHWLIKNHPLRTSDWNIASQQYNQSNYLLGRLWSEDRCVTRSYLCTLDCSAELYYLVTICQYFLSVVNIFYQL